MFHMPQCSRSRPRYSISGARIKAVERRKLDQFCPVRRLRSPFVRCNCALTRPWCQHVMSSLAGNAGTWQATFRLDASIICADRLPVARVDAPNRSFGQKYVLTAQSTSRLIVIIILVASAFWRICATNFHHYLYLFAWKNKNTFKQSGAPRQNMHLQVSL